MTKKIWDTLESQENQNDFYKVGNKYGKNEFRQSILYGASTFGNSQFSNEHIENVLQSLAIQDSIVQEFDNFIGFDGGNAVLAGLNTEYGLDRVLRGQKTSYWIAYSQACDRIGKRQGKNKNEKRMNKDGDIESIDDYTSGQILDNKKLESLEYQYGKQLQEIKTTIDKGNWKQKAKAKKELSSMLQHLGIDGVKFATKTTTTKEKTRAVYKTLTII